MLNKNDPLIGAVQEVMKRNQFEREAVKVVNEKFGVQDRKALPHEKQCAWDAAYKQVISEGIQTLKEEAETVAEESATAASKKAEKGTKWKVKSRNWDRDGSEVEVRQGKRVKMKGTYDRNASMFTVSKTKKGKFDPKSKAKDYDDAKDILKTVKESEQIDEISSGLARNYLKKAEASKKQASADHYKYGWSKMKNKREGTGLSAANAKKSDKALDTIVKRDDGISLARGKLTGDKHTKYIKASGRQKRDPGYTERPTKVLTVKESEQIDEISSKLAGNYLKGHHKSVNDPKGITIWKAFKRRDGKKLAVDKLSGTAKVPTKDE
jgi:hypothetical protein